MDILKKIKDRRSIRRFRKKSISAKIIEKVLEAGRWAPSGLNNQPWRFMILSGEEKDSLAVFTHCQHIIKACDKAILVFLDKEASYNYEKDLLAIGAAIQNMLLYVHDKRLGACWLGEILKKRTELCKKFKITKKLQLEAVLALGYPLHIPATGKRKALKKLIIK